MATQHHTVQGSQKHRTQDWLIRFALIYFLLQTIPFQWSFYAQLFALRWDTFVIDVLNLVLFTPHFFGPESTFLDWIVLAVIAAVAVILWQRSERIKPVRLNHDDLYYYLRVLVRYRLAAALFVFGFVKLFPSFAPEPSISHLNTGYGYFGHWKHFILSLGVAPAYLSFLGLVEVASALLLLFRRTAFLAVIFILPFYGNVFLSDLAYEGTGYVYSLFLLSLTFVLFLYDAQRFAQLTIHLQPTRPSSFRFSWADSPIRLWRIGLKGAFALLFVVVFGAKSYAIYKHGTLHYPETPGLEGAAGIYNVGLFVVNGDTIAYSPDHPTRWRDVVFEKWNTVSIRSNSTVTENRYNGIKLERVDSLRSYEYALAGDRQYYSYNGQGDQGQLVLQNRNPNYPDDRLSLDIVRLNSKTIVLEGLNANGDSLLARLDRLDKKYLIEEVKKVGRFTLGFKL
ncbi:DoxX family protein [Parapedobacter sp. 2B3]|uniref:DoxX family protein n=1 Tax=Parapedobacter sp. 2B3 TaxID=3342381 RepID=UPI0035B663A0